MQSLRRKESFSASLAHAAEAGNLEWLKSTLAAGVDVDASNVFGTTALMRAASLGHIQTVRLLLSYGADPNRVRNDKFTALALAAFFGHQDVVKCLVEHGADTNASTRFGTSPQMWASARTFRGVARYLGDKGDEPIRTSIDNSVDDPSAKENEHPNLRGSFSSVRLRLRVALSSLVLLFVVAVAEVIFEHRQAAPVPTSEPPLLTTESTPARTTVEKSVTEPAAQQFNASANLNHSEDSGRRNSLAAKTQNRVIQSQGKDNDVEEAPVSMAEEQKIKPQVAPRESNPPPIKVNVSRPTPASSKPAPSTTQLISSPANSTTKSKVIQWP